VKKEYFEILLERVEDKIDLVLEGHSALDKKIDRRFDELDEKIGLNTVKIEALSKKINEVKESLGERIDAVAVDLQAHRRDTEAHPGVKRA